MINCTLRFLWPVRAAVMACAALAFALPCGLVMARPPQAGTAIAPAPSAAELVQRLYSPDQPPRLWDDHGQAQLALSLLRAAHEHGLDPALYDVETLAHRLDNRSPHDADSVDKALSQAMLQLLMDLHGGRVQPDLDLPSPYAERRFDPVAHLRLALRQQRLVEALDAAAPAIPLYRRVKAGLRRYRALAALEQPWTAPTLRQPGVKLVLGNPYRGLASIRERLALLGDLDPGATDDGADTYSAPLAQAIRRFQARHGLAQTGHPGPGTLAALAVPLSYRVRQLELTLERLRWMPAFEPGPIIVVNVATYRLWAFDNAAGASTPALEMRVIVGKAARTPTPLFIGQMRHLEFNPYWNVPRSITLGEIIPKLARNPVYLDNNGMQLVTTSGQVRRIAPAAALAALRAGTLRVRQTPGAHNVLGAVKFAMPNPMVGSSRVDLQACKLEYSIVSPK